MSSLLDAKVAGHSTARVQLGASIRQARSAAEPHATGPAVFVVGADRSGTTMLRLILNRHPELAIPPESHFLGSLLAALPTRSPLTADQVRWAVDTIIGCRGFQTWQTPAHTLRETFLRQPKPTLAELVDAAFRLEIAGTGKPRWGDKTPDYAVLISQLNELFPQTRFVHIVRDGRDVSLSLRQRQWRGWTEYQRARYWADVVRTADAAGRRIGAERYLQIAYEDLVLSCESTVRRLCDFLCIPFYPSMLTFHEDAMRHIADFEQSAGIHEKLVRPPRPCDVGRWKRESSALRVWLFEAIAGRALDRFGIARRYSGCARWLGIMTAAPYRLIGTSLSWVQRSFERLPESAQNRLRHNRVLRRLKQTGCRC